MARLMIVDDERDLVFSLKRGLESHNFQVDSFVDASDAFRHFHPGEYDVALLDIGLPKMDGFQLGRLLLGQDPDLKICFFTGFDRFDEALAKFPEINSEQFIRKPIGMKQLVAIIDDVLNQKSTRILA
jgi:two-component system, OmpR family, response regulator PrrA